MLYVICRCKYNCKLKVVSSHRFALKAKAIGLPLNLPKISYTWKLYRKGPESNASITVWHLNKTLNSLTATKTTKKNIVFAKDKLHESSSYRLTLDVKLPNGTSGWAAYIFETASKPSGGACSGTQLERADSKGWDSSSCIPDSIEQDFGFHQQNFPDSEFREAIHSRHFLILPWIFGILLHCAL